MLSPGELLANTSQNSIGTDTYTISASINSASPITGIFLDAIKNPSLPGGGPGGQYGNGNFVVSEFTLDATFKGVTVTAGQTYNVSSGQTDIGDIVENGGTLNVFSGGAISGTQDSGTVNVSLGGTATDTVILNAVLLNVYGTTVGTVVYGSGLEIVYSGGTAVGTVVNIGAQVVEFGGTAISPPPSTPAGIKQSMGSRAGPS